MKNEEIFDARIVIGDKGIILSASTVLEMLQMSERLLKMTNGAKSLMADDASFLRAAFAECRKGVEWAYSSPKPQPPRKSAEK